MMLQQTPAQQAYIAQLTAQQQQQTASGDAMVYLLSALLVGYGLLDGNANAVWTGAGLAAVTAFLVPKGG